MIGQSYILSDQLLAYAASRFETYSYLNGNNIPYPHGAFPTMIGMGIKHEYKVATTQDYDATALDAFLAKHRGQYILGYVSYGLKNALESFSLSLHDPLAFPLIHLYVPQYLFVQEQGQWKAYDDTSEQLLQDIQESGPVMRIALQPEASAPVEQFSHEQYLRIIQRIKEELAKGNIYEINFCNSYSGTYLGLDYTTLYKQLNEISPMPFSALHADRGHVLLSASPERFLQKKNTTLISQPIKGTAGRKKDTREDALQKQQLEQSLKERTENIMIVDLVRNDLSKLCTGGSVIVEELCKVYTFERVHQMISTILGELEHPETSFSDILRALFPMGSMTGAPKLKAMQLIDELEQEDRGLFSGAFGYIHPNGDFDFNVIIRSLLFNQQKGLYKFHAGSAITMASDAEQEYLECGIKTLPIRLLLKEFIKA